MRQTSLRPSRRSLLRAFALGALALAPRLALPGRVRAGATATEAMGRSGAALALADDAAIPLLIPDDIGDDEAWVDVNLTYQAVVAMIGSEWTRVALATTGKPGWETPTGEFRINRRVANETMTSAALDITDPNDQYVLTDVLYTQYFTNVGHALHLNYWQPDAVFGRERTSHGCVGMRLADAEYLWRHVGIGSRVVIHDSSSAQRISRSKSASASAGGAGRVGPW